MSNATRKIARKNKKVSESNDRIKYRNALISQGIPKEEVDKLIKDNPEIVKEKLTYEEVVSGYDLATLSIKYNNKILDAITDMEVTEGVDATKHEDLLKGTKLNQKTILDDHLAILDIVEAFRNKHGEVEGEDLLQMVEISSLTGLTQNTTLQLQEAIFLTLAMNVNLDISNAGGVK